MQNTFSDREFGRHLEIIYYNILRVLSSKLEMGKIQVVVWVTLVWISDESRWIILGKQN